MTLTLRDITKRYGDKCVLADLDLELSSSKRYVLAGASGIGKTTLLRLISGLELADSGSVSLPSNAVISYAFQEPRLFPELTVLENLQAIQPERDCLQLLSELDLLAEANSYPAELSGGMKKRAGLARALSKIADIYMIDEPTGGQDLQHSYAVADAINTYTTGSICIVSTHDANLASVIADEMIVFHADGVTTHDIRGKSPDEISTLMQ